MLDSRFRLHIASSFPRAARPSLVATTLLGALIVPAYAQVGASPEAAPVVGEIINSPAPQATPPTPVGVQAAPGAPAPMETPVPLSTETDTTRVEGSDPNPAKLSASKFSYGAGSIISAQGTPTDPVRFESKAGKVWADDVRIDTVNRTLEAKGTVRLERVIAVQQRELRSRKLKEVRRTVDFTETAYGVNLNYDFNTQKGKLENARLYTSGVNLSAENILIDGNRYTAQNIIAYPGGLTEAERKIYGTPPLNLRARQAVVTRDATTGQGRVSVRGAYLYYRKTKLIPLPAYAFNASGGGGDPSSPRLTPGISVNQADNVLLTSRFILPIDKAVPERLSLAADVGLSARVGLRGGAALTSSNQLGNVALSLRRSDIVTTQLTNRIELDRVPELALSSRPFATFALPGGRKAGFVFDGSYGEYNERFINSGGNTRGDRLRGRLTFTTRLAPTSGLFFRLFTAHSAYKDYDLDYNNTGYEIGYDGQLLPRVRGQISYRSTSINGETPFRFDRVEIRSEVRATFDVTLTPRYLLPFDVRYDVSQSRVRDTTFGVLRSYKNFAYGLVYQTVRKDLRLEVRNAF